MPRVPVFILTSLLALLAGCVSPTGWIDHRQGVSVGPGYTVTRNLVYTPDDWPEPVLGDLYRPRSTQPAPAVLLVHAGGWSGGDGRWQMSSIAAKLAKRGYAVLNVTYRLGPRWNYPAPVEDMQAAVRWLRAHAAEQRIDPSRIATFGYSAGGYLAALTGLSGGVESCHIRAIVMGGAPSDLAFYARGDLVRQFLGGTLQEIPQRFAEASPANHVTANSPPLFLYHGTDDHLVRPEHPLAMIAELEKYRVPHETYWIEGRGHIGAFLWPAGSVDAAIDFLDRQMR